MRADRDLQLEQDRESKRFAELSGNAGRPSVILLPKAQAFSSDVQGASSLPGAYMTAYDPQAVRATQVQQGALLYYLDGQHQMSLGGVTAAAVMLSTNNVVGAAATTDVVGPLDNLAVPMGNTGGTRLASGVRGFGRIAAALSADELETLARQQFTERAAWKNTAKNGDELFNHAFDRHPSLATTEIGTISPELYDARARSNILNPGSELHSIGGTRYGAFNQSTGEFTVFSFEGGGGVAAGQPTIHSYYIPLRNSIKNGVPFNSQGRVNLSDIWPR
jgi:hypothetical protein